MDKQTLRAEIRAKKRAMTPAQIEAASGRLAELLFAHPAYRAAKSLYGYLSYNQEVRTAKILQQAQKDGKRVAVWEPTMPSGGMLITNPIPHQYAMPKDVIDAAINQALAEAKEQGIPAVSGKCTLFSNARTIIENPGRCFMKLVAERDTGRLIGAQLMCQHASDMISQISAAMVNHQTAEDLRRVMRPHPSFEEAMMEALEALVAKLEKLEK